MSYESRKAVELSVVCGVHRVVFINLSFGYHIRIWTPREPAFYRQLTPLRYQSKCPKRRDLLYSAVRPLPKLLQRDLFHTIRGVPHRPRDGTRHEKVSGAQLTRALSISSVGIARRCVSCACT